MGKKRDSVADSAAENIKVLVRCRPLNEGELENGYKSCVELNLSEANVTIHHVCGAPDRWTFDAVINNTYTQKDIFTQYIRPMVDSVLEGFNSTVFAYGQSGSGKTYTMTGKMEDDDQKGLIPRCFEYVFSQLRLFAQTQPNRHYTLYCSFVELYNGKVRDLLAKQQVPLAVKENKDKTFFVQGSHMPQVKFPEDLYRHMEEGTERRKVASTELNADSSRSHSIFSLIMECTETSDDGDTRSVTSKLNLVDLAGSERQSKTQATGDTLKEGCNINLSLSALGTVIDTLVKGKGHVPFRSSPLTMLLKDSLGGSSKTCMFANIGPSEHNLSETVSTLRFADRAKQIKNKPVVNMDSKDQKIAELTELVNELKEKLKMFEGGGIKELESELEELREKVGELEIEKDNAHQGRQADATEFEQRNQALESELSMLKEEKAEMLEKLQQLGSDLHFAEQCVKDEKAQRQEVLRACGEYLDSEVGDVDSLVKLFSNKAHGVTMDQFLQLQSEHRQLVADFNSAKQEHSAEIAEWQHKLAEAEEEKSVMNKKIKKLKGALEGERNARKQLVETHATDTSPMKSFHSMHRSSVTFQAQPPTDGAQQDISPFSAPPAGQDDSVFQSEISRLEQTITDLEQAKGADESAVDALQEDLRKVTQEKTDAINDLLAQLKEATDLIAKPSESDSVLVAKLKEMLKAKEKSLEHAHSEIDTLESQIQQQVRKKKLKRATVACCAEEAATKKIDEFHKHQRDNLRDELVTTTNHRNKLLEHLADESGVDASSELHTIAEENTALRERAEKAAAALEAAQCDAMELERLRAHVATLESSISEEKDAALLADELAKKLQIATAQIARMREEHQEREQQWIASATASGDGAENPLSSVVAVLQSDKAQLIAQLNQLDKELHAQLQLSTRRANDQRNSEESMKEITRLHQLLSVPAESDTEEVALLKSELRKRDEELRQISEKVGVDSGAGGGGEATEVIKSEHYEKLEEELHKAEHDLRSKASIFAMEKEEITAELEAAKAECQEERDRRERLEEEVQKAGTEVKLLRSDLLTSQKSLATAENKIEEQHAEFARLQSDSENSSKIIAQFESRLKERTDQLNDLRTLLDKQKSMLQKSQERGEELAAQLRAAKAAAEKREREHQKALADKEESIHRAMNKKIELLAEQHSNDLAKKDEEIQRERKKVAKMEAKVQKAKERYDEKVCEYADLLNRMEEQKYEAMKMMKDAVTVEVEESKEQIRGTLEMAREEQRRKRDMFELGEATTALSGVRASGPAPRVVSKMKSLAAGARGTGGSAGANGPVTPTDRGDLFDF